MRKLYYTLIISLILAACGKDSNDDKQQTFQAEGTLTAYDPSFCPTICCGGIHLTIDHDPAKYKIQSLPNMTFQQIGALPRRISFDYQLTLNCPNTKVITITNYVLH